MQHVVDIFTDDPHRIYYVLPNQLELRIFYEVSNIRRVARNHTVDADDLMPLREKSVDEVGSEESGSAKN